MKRLILTLTVAVLGSVKAQELSFGKCPNFPVVQNFNVDQVRVSLKSRSTVSI